MICHEFKGGIGTSSRVLSRRLAAGRSACSCRPTTARATCSASTASRSARLIPGSEVPASRERARRDPGDGSIIVIVATTRRSCRTSASGSRSAPSIGLARVGGIGANSIGDIFLAFATGNRGLPARRLAANNPLTVRVGMVANDRMTPLFEACAEATEEAIVNASARPTTTTGINGTVAHELPADGLVDAMERRGALRQ